MEIEKYLPAARDLNTRAYSQGISPASLLMGREGDLTIDYAPFDHIERGAELVLVGLTPGRTQATNALASLASDLNASVPLLAALANAKRTASFSGAMRNNLLAMLDEIGVPAAFKRGSASEFFSAGARVHFTSALRYPVYVAGKNYSRSPDPLTTPILRRMIETHLAEEALALPKAVWIPLGGKAETALLHLVSKNQLRREQVLVGLPHPSGANAERIAYFLGRKGRSALSAKTNADRIESAKAKLAGQVAALAAV
ncbi:MAG: hypothetical protein EOO15_15370 [Chitinophagaceae bacterium]|nr:MAG: hypothetical protein EOO15_15370 [Chitinophagaceae bacterium]